jgi:hypothetical protein
MTSRRSGSAGLPLHGGHVLPWLASRMARLGSVICEAIVHQYGDQLLRRLAHPSWLQGFSAGLGWTGTRPASPRASPAPCPRGGAPVTAPIRKAGTALGFRRQAHGNRRGGAIDLRHDSSAALREALCPPHRLAESRRARRERWNRFDRGSIPA